MTRGFVIMAQDTDKVSYTKCAKALELSIKKVMPNSSVTIITSDMLPYGNLGGYKNDWQVYAASPYEYTIKLEADMYLPQSIDYYWDVLKERDVVVSTNIRNFRQDISDVRYYRRFIDDNNLPDTYNAITYFRKGELAEKFFNIVRDVFENWEEYKRILQCKVDELCTTDWAYAIAAHILGAENTTMPQFDAMSMVHMKQFINGSATENWTDSLIHELFPYTFRINTIPQVYPVHYHIKNFANVILEKFGE